MNITDQKVMDLLEQGLSQGIIPWDAGFIRGMKGLEPKGVSGVYRGMNAVLTALAIKLNSYDSDMFLTFHEVKKRGGRVKAGAKASIILKPNPIYFDKSGNKITEEEYERLKAIDPKSVDSAVWFSTVPVFNLACTEGIKYEKITVKLSGPDLPDTKADDLAQNWVGGPKIDIFDYVDTPCYRPVNDTISCPNKKLYKGSDYYDQTLLHEMVHATGAKTRLDRSASGKFGSSSYAKEELVAEIGSEILLARLGYSDRELETQTRNSAEYLRSWLKSVKDKKNVTATLTSAYNKAVKAADYIIANQASATVKAC